MASTPRASIVDDVIQGFHCAICGEDALHVVHIERLPDYVECDLCGSAFIMEEDGERVLYGQIAEGYPQTSRFALKQWAWIEAVDARAREERPPADEGADSTPLPPESADLAAYPALEPDEPSTVEEDAAEEPWKIFEEPVPDEPLEIIDVGEPTPPERPETFDQDEFPEPLRAESEHAPDGSTSDEPDEASLAVDEEGGMWRAYEAGMAAEDDLDLDEMDEMDGFDWLGGLADEDNPLEEPDAASFPESPIVEEAPSSASEIASGLSSEDLDDLFRSETEDEIDTPAFGAEHQERDSEMGGAEGVLERDQADPDLPEQLPGLDRSDPEESMRDAVDDDVNAPDEWLQGVEQEQVDRSSPAFADFDAPAVGSSEADEDDSDDFLSSLRDSAAIPLESQPLEHTSLEETAEDGEEPAPPDWALEEQAAEIGSMAARMQSVTSERGEEDEEPPQAKQPDHEERELEAVREDVINYRENDPPPGYRHRVMIRGDRVVFPGGECVHCGQTPVRGQLAIAGTLPEGQGMGDRKPTRFQVPLCAECRDRATTLSEDAQSARIQSILFSLIIGMAFVVGSLAFSLVDPGDMQLADWFILVILFIIGFAGSAIVLLNRIGNYPPPLDAAYVRTTLLVPTEAQGLETAFEWRSPEYAQRFYEANESNALGNVTQVKDRLVIGTP
ncbi:MAG: hypothetical protein P1P76_02780 [Anaerolineales bacterium]|nr:hypothetical protein [Anaerolineales bacterium]